jgi:predicted transposase/invertase (TIGR01784 family)
MRESPIYQDILAEGRQEGRQDAIAEIATNLLLSGMSVEQIMNVTGLTRERVEQFEELRVRVRRWIRFSCKVG